MISILPPQKMTSSDDEVAQLEAQLQKARAKKAAWKAVEAKRVAEEKAVAEVRCVEEEQRRVELQERWSTMAVVKVWTEEAEEHWVAEEELAAARRRVILAMAETAVEETGTEQDGRSPSKQKGWVEGKQLVCDCCVMQGFNCQVNRI